MHLSLLNGEPHELNLQHRGLAYGDGVFETIKIKNHYAEFLTQHITRLAKGAQALGLRWIPRQSEQLTEQLQRLADQAEGEHVCKVMLLRNTPGRGYDFDPDTQDCDLILQMQPYAPAQWSQHGVNVVISDVPVSENPYLAGHKHLNRLDSVLARQDARKAGVEEAIMLDQQGFVIEGTMSNVFLKTPEGWVTPLLANAGVNGIVRSQLLAFHAEISEKKIHIDGLNNIQSAFITNSLIGVVPVKRINQQVMADCADITLFQKEIQRLC